jgi:FtsZ-binding cell division protein ZapB
VFGEYERADEAYQEHLQIIDRVRSGLDAALKRIQVLEKENVELKAKNTALHRRQFKANKNRWNRLLSQERSEALRLAIAGGSDLHLLM